MPIKAALILSVILQFGAAIIALTLVKRTRTNIAWWLISAGFLLMAFRRVFEILQVYDAQSKLITGLLSSWTGVLISIIMLLSLAFIRRIFNIQKQIDVLKRRNESRVLSAIIKTEETERQYFAKELHDGLGPLLSSVKMALSTGHDDLLKNRRILANAEKLIDESIIVLKEISNRLSPHILTDFGLLKAVRSFISKLPEREDQPKISFNSNTGDRRFQFNIETVLYRVICELISNTLNHADAKNIYIDLMADSGSIALEYIDDGSGFDPEREETDQKGMGYSNIRSRIRSLNGKYDLYSRPDEGVRVNIMIELE